MSDTVRTGRVLTRYGEVTNTGHRTALVRVGIQVSSNDPGPDRLLASQARATAAENGFRKVVRVGHITTDSGEPGTVWHRAVYKVGK